jgi:hypothetical protein
MPGSLLEVGGVQRVPVDDQMARVFQEAACRVRQVAGDLRHPCPVGTVGDAGDVNEYQNMVIHVTVWQLLNVVLQRQEAVRDRDGQPGYHKPMRYFSLVALVALAGFSCNSSSSGTPEDCMAAGGQCVLTGPGNTCAKMGPENTCNCNPTCTTGGAFCCIEFTDAGDGGDD